MDFIKNVIEHFIKSIKTTWSFIQGKVKDCQVQDLK